MKQHLNVFKPNGKSFCKEYLCVVNPVCILTLKITQMTILMLRLQIRVLKKNFLMRRLIKTEQIFDFITVLSFVSLYSGSSIESLYSVEVTGKGVANEDISDHYGHFVAKVRDTFKVLPETGSFKKCQGQTVLYASY